MSDYDKMKPDPYRACPEYESEHFFLRLVSLSDAEDLLACYKHPTISVEANAENCTYGYGAQTVEEMRSCIGKWLEAYAGRHFIRLGILDKRRGALIGTVEIYGSGHMDSSILRIDVEAQYESEAYLSELIKISDSFFADIPCGNIASKVLPEARFRISALKKNCYVPFPRSGDWDRDDYYIKSGS